MTVGIVSPGHMGSGLGFSLARGGARVVATVAGRSDRTARLAVGLELLPDLDAVVAESDVVLVVTPPAAAVAAAESIGAAARRTGTTPLVVDMNAVAPDTVHRVRSAVGSLPLVDGSISGGPPTVVDGTHLYFSGPRAAEVVDLPWTGVVTRVVGAELGRASALKMCTASVYKGTAALWSQAMITAARNDVLEEFLADVDRNVPSLPEDVARAATKAHRYVGEMREIATTQRAAGLSAELFEAMAAVWEQVAEGALAAQDPETVDVGMPPSEMVERLLPGEAP
jgi:3-hydroxyisobutyrate dehydrogenase-like beta-hydroxyacid dehydrogenase